ncbi:transposase, partial [Escherichia coli]
GTADRNRSHWSTSKTPSYTKSVSWQHHRMTSINGMVHGQIYSSLIRCGIYHRI